MSPQLITPQAAQQLLENGAVLVDIRTADEYAREHIAQARNLTLTQLPAAKAALEKAPAVIFHCRSGKRTQLNAATLAACVSCDSYLLSGGLDAWKQAGMPVIADHSQPLELQRQVQIATGSMIVLATILGVTVSPWFLAVTGLIGAGLIMAGVTGFCGLAFVLMKMPWNRKIAA